MMKNRFLTAFAFAGVLGFAACAADEEAEFNDAPLEEVTPAPEITPDPVTVDTTLPPLADSVVTDSVTM